MGDAVKPSQREKRRDGEGSGGGGVNKRRQEDESGSCTKTGSSSCTHSHRRHDKGHSDNHTRTQGILSQLRDTTKASKHLHSYRVSGWELPPGLIRNGLVYYLVNERMCLKCELKV